MKTYLCVCVFFTLPDHVTRSLRLTSLSPPPAGGEGPSRSSRSSAQPERPDGDPQHPPPAEEPQPGGQKPVRTHFNHEAKPKNITLVCINVPLTCTFLLLAPTPCLEASSPVEHSPFTGPVCPTGTRRSGRLTDQPPTRFPRADLGPAGPRSRARPLPPVRLSLSRPGAGILLLLGPSCHWFPAPVKQGLSMRSSAGHDCKPGIMGRPVSLLAR